MQSHFRMPNSLIGFEKLLVEYADRSAPDRLWVVERSFLGLRKPSVPISWTSFFLPVS